ncbi:hypothetical protein AMTRI_Chr13g85390 [Amborella trichopoda]
MPSLSHTRAQHFPTLLLTFVLTHAPITPYTRARAYHSLHLCLRLSLSTSLLVPITHSLPSVPSSTLTTTHFYTPLAHTKPYPLLHPYYLYSPLLPYRL